MPPSLECRDIANRELFVAQLISLAETSCFIKLGRSYIGHQFKLKVILIILRVSREFGPPDFINVSIYRYSWYSHEKDTRFFAHTKILNASHSLLRDNDTLYTFIKNK